MLVALAWRNLARNLRRSILTGLTVTVGVVLVMWHRGFLEGAYVQIIDQAVRARLGHVQVLPPGYLQQPSPDRTLADAPRLVQQLARLEHVQTVAPRAAAGGLLSRDDKQVAVQLSGVEPGKETAASSVPDQLLRGDRAVRWCLDQLGAALEVMGGDQGLFERWCKATAESEYLPAEEPRAVVLGTEVARRLLVTTGDEVLAQTVRVSDGEASGGGRVGRRRLVVTGVVQTGNPELDERMAYLRLETLTDLVGTDQPNELVLFLDDLRALPAVQASVTEAVAGQPARVWSWAQRAPAMKKMLDLDSQYAGVFQLVLILLVALGVINATSMSVLERTREFGVMLGLGMRRRHLFALIMLEVALLGAIAVALGGLLGCGLELFGRLHGWPVEWFGWDNLNNMAIPGVTYEPIFYSGITLEWSMFIIVGVYGLYLGAGLLPALHASRLQAIKAMRCD